jgi:hypothetical protein
VGVSWWFQIAGDIHATSNGILKIILYAFAKIIAKYNVGLFRETQQ